MPVSLVMARAGGMDLLRRVVARGREGIATPLVPHQPRKHPSLQQAGGQG